MAHIPGSLSVSIVGAGRVGSALAALLHSKGFRIVSVVSRRRSSARQLAALVRCRQYSQDLADLHPSTNFLLIATADEAISTVARRIARLAPLNFPKLYAAHTSGLLTSDELAPLQRKGATVLSLHPVQTFPRQRAVHQHVRALNGISYGVEGSPSACRFARSLVTRLGGRLLEVPKEEKISYHLACVFASNYSVALLGAVHAITKDFAALRHFEKLVLASVENAFSLTPQGALTGPIARGSVKAVQQHLTELRARHRGLVDLYRAAGRLALELAEREYTLPPKTVRRLKQLLKP